MFHMQYNIQFTLQALGTGRQQHADKEPISYYHDCVIYDYTGQEISLNKYSVGFWDY